MEGPVTLPRSRRWTFARTRRAHSPGPSSSATFPTVRTASSSGRVATRSPAAGSASRRSASPPTSLRSRPTGTSCLRATASPCPPGRRSTTGRGCPACASRRTSSASRQSPPAPAGATTDSSYVYVRPIQAEESEITASMSLNVFPASVRLDGEGKIERGRLTVAGSLHEVAVERLEQAWVDGVWDVDPNGAAIAGARVAAEITELVPVRELKRQVYDFIAKQVVDQYEYRIDEVARGTQTLTTGPDGTFRLSVPAAADHNYSVALSTTDPQGRTTRLGVYASVPWEIPDIYTWSQAPRLVRSCGPENERGSESASLAIGDPFCLAARDGRGDLPSGGPNRYLFFAAQRGLRDAVVSGTPTFEARFTAADVPNLAVTGVRFTGDAMVPIGSFIASFDATERELTVALA